MNYLQEYGLSHQNPINKKIHFICVPVIFFNVLFFIIYFGGHKVFWLLTLLVFIFYFKKTRDYFYPMIILYFFTWLLALAITRVPHALQLNVALFIFAWIGQFVGHKIEGKKPSFFKDILFLLIGPLWIYADLILDNSTRTTKIFTK